MAKETIASQAAAAEQQVERARAGGNASSLIAAARTASAVVRNLVPGPISAASGEERDALIGMKRFLFNAAADCWPGWEADSPSVNRADLEAARDLAAQSAVLVSELELGPLQAGTAEWLIGAFDLALGSFDAALGAFAEAAVLYERARAPGLVLLVRGYFAIAQEAAGRPATEAGLPSILEAIAAGNYPDGTEFADQLKTAHKVFV